MKKKETARNRGLRGRTDRSENKRLAHLAIHISSIVQSGDSELWRKTLDKGYWGATEQKSSIRKMSSDFLEGVECVPQRSQFAATYGF
jgi:hypothetical protein